MIIIVILLAVARTHRSLFSGMYSQIYLHIVSDDISSLLLYVVKHLYSVRRISFVI